MKKILRNIAYGIPFFGQINRKIYDAMRSAPDYRTKKYWDDQLSSGLSSYLRGTFSHGLRDTHSSMLINAIFPEAKSILDIGCAGASLASVLGDKYDYYCGVDISAVAIDDARKYIDSVSNKPKIIDLTVSDLHAFATDKKLDVILFNEVLYYLNINDVNNVIKKYESMLSDNGIIIVSLKDDKLSRMIHDKICKKLKWKHGIIFQEHTDKPAFRLLNDRRTPPFIVSAFGIPHST